MAGGNPSSYMSMRDYINQSWQSQQPVERNPSEYRSMRDYRDQWMSAPSDMLPPEYDPLSQPQPPQPISPIEQAILDFTKLVGDAVDEQKKLNAQLSEKIHTEENSMDQRLDGLNIDFEHKWDNLQDSIEDLIDQQHCPPEEDCQSNTMAKEPCLHQPQEGLVENFESSVGAAVCLREKKEATSPLLTEEGSETKAVDEPKELISKPFPMELNPTATAQATKSPLPIAPSIDQLYVLLASQSQHKTPEAPTTKTTPSLPILQNLKKLVAIAHIVATTSKKLATAHIAWHSEWFGCRFGFGASEPRHF